MACNFPPDHRVHYFLLPLHEDLNRRPIIFTQELIQLDHVSMDVHSHEKNTFWFFEVFVCSILLVPFSLSPCGFSHCFSQRCISVSFSFARFKRTFRLLRGQSVDCFYYSGVHGIVFHCSSDVFCCMSSVACFFAFLPPHSAIPYTRMNFIDLEDSSTLHMCDAVEVKTIQETK